MKRWACFHFCGLYLKLSHPPTKMHPLKPSPVGHGEKVFHLGGNDDITAARLVQSRDELPRKVTGVGEKTNPRPGNVGGDFFQTALDHEPCPGVAGRISRAQRAMPELLAMTLKTENGMIGRTPLLSGIVAFASSLLLAIESQHHRIQMKLQLRARLGQSKQLRSQLIMQSHQLADGRRRQAPKETAQRRRIGKLLQSDQREKQAVVLQNLGLVHALNTGDQDVEESEDHVLGAIVDPRRCRFENTLETTAQTELVTKSLDQEQPAKMGQGVALERKLQCLQASSHSQPNQIAGFSLVSISSQLVRLLTPPNKAL